MFLPLRSIEKLSIVEPNKAFIHIRLSYRFVEVKGCKSAQLLEGLIKQGVLSVGKASLPHLTEIS